MNLFQWALAIVFAFCGFLIIARMLHATKNNILLAATNRFFDIVILIMLSIQSFLISASIFQKNEHLNINLDLFDVSKYIMILVLFLGGFVAKSDDLKEIKCIKLKFDMTRFLSFCSGVMLVILIWYV